MYGGSEATTLLMDVDKNICESGNLMLGYRTMNLRVRDTIFPNGCDRCRPILYFENDLVWRAYGGFQTHSGEPD